MKRSQVFMFKNIPNSMQLRLTVPLVISGLLFMPLLVSGVVSYSSFLLPLAIFVSYLIGEVVLVISGINQFKLAISRACTSILLGSLLGSLTVFLFPRNGILQLTTVCLLAFLLLSVFRKKMVVSMKLSPADWAAFTVAVLLTLFVTMGSEMVSLTLPFQEMLSTSISDQFFFTANVVTIRNGSIFNAVYEQGSALNFHSLGFFVPAWWGDILNISSHQALYGLSMPFYKLLSFLLFFELATFFVDNKISTKYIYILLAMGLVIILAPLHPLYLLKGDVRNFIFSGMGYLLPTGSPTYTFAIPLCLLSLFLFLNIDWSTQGITGPKVLFTLLFSLLAISKLPIFFCSFVFVAAIIFKRLLFDKERIIAYLPYGLSAVLLSCVLYKTILSNDVASRTSIKYGYLVNRFAQLFQMTDNGTTTHITILLLIFAVFALWIGIRFVGLVALVRSGNKRLSELAVAAIATLVVSVLLNLFLHIDLVDRHGTILRDGTFDVEQFIRSSFFLITVASAIGIVYFVASKKANYSVKRAVACLLVFWSVASVSSLAVNSSKAGTVVRHDWYKENYQQLESGRLNDGLILVSPFSIHGIMLSSSDFGTYWCAQAQGEGCYNSTLKNAYRWDIYRDIISSPSRASLDILRREGVKYIIATPADKDKIEALSGMLPKMLRKMEQSSWIYEVQ